MRVLWRLRDIRDERAMTQEELAEAAGVGQDTISQLERHEREAQPRTIKKLAKALGVEPRELMKEEQ